MPRTWAGDHEDLPGSKRAKSDTKCHWDSGNAQGSNAEEMLGQCYWNSGHWWGAQEDRRLEDKKIADYWKAEDKKIADYHNPDMEDRLTS